MKNEKKMVKTIISLVIASTLLSSIASFGLFGRGGGHRGHRGYRSHRGRGGIGFGIGFGGRRGGVGFGIGGRRGGVSIGFGSPGYWSRPGWGDWSGPYWGARGGWLGYRDNWRDQKHRWPKISNETGERIKFYVSDRYRSQYTLTVVTESGQTKTFTGLELPEMRFVEVIMDDKGELQVAPR